MSKAMVASSSYALMFGGESATNSNRPRHIIMACPAWACELITGIREGRGLLGGIKLHPRQPARPHPCGAGAAGGRTSPPQ